MKETLFQANVFLIAAAFLFNVPLFSLKSLRWQQILKRLHYYVSFKNTFLYYTSSIYLGFITPGRIGEFAKVFYLKQECDLNTSEIFLSVFLDRFYDLFLLILLSMMGFIILNPFVWAKWIGYIGLVCLLFLLLIVKNKLVYKSIWILLNRLFSNFGISKKIISSKLPETTRFFLLHNSLWLGFLITILSYLLFFFQCSIIAKALSITVSFVDLIYIMAITNFISFLPFSISGIGTREASLAFLLTPKGIALESVLAYSTAIFLVFFIGGGIIGFGAWQMKPLKINLKTLLNTEH